MRDRIDHWLVLAMVFVEAVRGVIDIRHFIHWTHDLMMRWAKGSPSWKHHSVKWGALAAGCVIALVPCMYYGVHAALIT